MWCQWWLGSTTFEKKEMLWLLFEIKAAWIFHVLRAPWANPVVLTNLRTGLDLRTNTSTHFTWYSPRFIPVVLISGLIFAKTHSPSLALKRFLSHVIAWDTTLVSRGQTAIFLQGVYRLQYKPCRKNSGLATRD